jgi:hypothetical protein
MGKRKKKEKKKDTHQHPSLECSAIFKPIVLEHSRLERLNSINILTVHVIDALEVIKAD